MAPPPPVGDDLHEPLGLGPHTVGGIWRALLPADLVELRLPRERFADCSICPPAIRGEYDPGCRCCGYTPHVPNVSLGLALENPDVAPRIHAAISGHLALPSGLWASPARFRRSMAIDATERFGTDPTMACTFLTGEGGCGIYGYRNAVCSTFFCVNDHGEEGENLWDSMQGLLGNAETAAAQWAMGEAGLPWDVQAERMAELAEDLDRLSTIDERWTAAALQHIWGYHWGREAEFYADCVAAVRANREGLFDRLSLWPVTDAVEYEIAVRDWVPEEHRDGVPPIAQGTIRRAPIDDLWYRMKIRIRKLWSLPFGKPLRWADGIRIAGPSGKLPLLMGARHRVAGADQIFWLDDAELALLRRFEGGASIDTELLDSAESEAVEDARALLSFYLRRGILIEA